VLASKLLTNAKFQNLQDLNSRTFRGFSSTFKHLICFQALSRAFKFLFQIHAFSRISQARYEPCTMLKTVIKPPAAKIKRRPVHCMPQVNAYNVHDAGGVLVCTVG